jgi:pyruvate dehydrogenase E2 component (dihydrolipoamide acetyltransferase)
MATLAIGRTYWQPIPQDNGFDFVKSAMLTLCFDHRIANGVGAANFLADVRDNIEQFSL